MRARLLAPPADVPTLPDPQIVSLGDHVYGDIVRSKKGGGWRTMLVIPELEAELGVATGVSGAVAELQLLRARRDALDDEVQRLEWRARHGCSSVSDAEPAASSSALASSDEDDDGALAAALASARERRDALRARHSALLRAHHERFHPVWGQLFKTGYQSSRFAHQVERYACLYTSHASNLLLASPLKSWKGRVDTMAHEDGGGGGGDM